MKLTPTEASNRYLLAEGPDLNLEIEIKYRGDSSGRKAVVLDNQIIPAITAAVNAHEDMREALKMAEGCIASMLDQGHGTDGMRAVYRHLINVIAETTP